jgi:hypothetical protein
MFKNLFGKYSYFSKVEWDFSGRSGHGTKIRPNQDEIVEASEKLLNVLVPLLEKEHWPDWKQGQGIKDPAKTELINTANIELDKE